MGNKIDIIIEKNSSTNKNSVQKFSVPITKSTTIEITKNEENRIISKNNPIYKIWLTLNYWSYKKADKIICIGDHLKIAVISRDPRCAIITHDPVTGLPDTDTLSIIRTYRKNLGSTYFGVYGSVVQSGSVSVGTDVILF